MRPQDQAPIALLIDDSPYIHRLLAVKLKDEGIEFLAAFSGPEGLELAESQTPSIILLDVNMPDMDGFEVLRRLKADTRTMGIPVIMLSGQAKSTDKVMAFDMGAMDFVPKPFDVHELRARIQSAIKITQLMRLLENQARIDGLTGLWNRAYFNERLESELSNAIRRSTPISLVMCDLDHFKRLNDTFGHPAGDAVLQGFAQVLRAELRAYDIACRYGGEEFALILPGATQVEASGVCERIRGAISEKSWRKYPEMKVTGSFGVTSAGLSGLNDASSWIEAADRALYAAKTGGRNQVKLFDERLGAEQQPLKMAG